MKTKKYEIDTYIKDFSAFDRAMTEKLEKIFEEDKELKDIYSYFDKYIGGVLVPDYIWYAIDDSCVLKSKLQKKDAISQKYKYILHTDNGVLLRGASTYYFLLASKGMYEDVSFNYFLQWMINYNDYFEMFGNVEFNFDNEFDKYIALGVLDNYRNYYLCLINAYIAIQHYNCDNVLIFNDEDEQIMQLINCLRYIYKNMKKIVTSFTIKNDVFYEISCQYQKTKLFFLNFISDHNVESKIWNMAFKSYRETDNFAEAYISLSLFNCKDELPAIGIMSGGIEIPILMSCLSNMRVTRIGFLLLNSAFPDYHKKISISYDDIGSLPKQCILCDENILTGNTMGLAEKYLSGLNYGVKKYFILRRVSTNRVFHLLSYDKQISLDNLNNYIEGLLFVTRYTKIKEKSNIGGMYYDELYRFDLAKEKLYEIIYINGLYAQNSRVKCFDNVEEAFCEKIRRE